MHASAAGVIAVVRGGSTSDPDGREGLAHLVEHLTFRAVDVTPGTPLPLASRDAKSTVRATRRERLLRYTAAGTNGLTSTDAMTFFEFGPPTRLPWLLELESARLTDPLVGVDETAVALERRVIAAEADLRDDPRTGLWASSHLFPLLFPPGHPYARPVSGTPPSRAQLTLADARAFASAAFRPERMMLFVTAPSGNTDLQAIIDRLPKVLVGDPAHPVERPAQTPTTPLPVVVPSPVVRIPSPLPRPQLWLAWTMPDGFGRARPREALLVSWLGEDLDLDQLRKEEPHIRQVRVSLQPGRQASALTVRVLMDDQADPDRVAQVVSARVASLWTREPTERPLLQRLQDTFITELILDEPPQISRAIEQAHLLAFDPPLIQHARVMTKVAWMPTAAVARFAREQLGQQRRHAVLFTPMPSASPSAGAGASLTPTLPRRPSWIDPIFAVANTWDPLELPGIRAPVGNVTTRRLSTGLTVIVARRRSAGVTAWLGFHGGYADANPPLIAELAMRARPEAINAPRDHALSGRATTIDASIETMEFGPEDLAPALSLLFAKASVPIRSWPSGPDLEGMLLSMKAEVDAASETANQAFLRALFGDQHPLARDVTAKDLPQVTQAAVESWIGRVNHPSNAALVVVGDVDADEVARYATELSRKDPVKGAGASVEVPPPAPPPRRPSSAPRLRTLVTPRAGTLIELRLGCLLPESGAANRSDYEMLRFAIQERLNSALRIERGNSYVVAVSTQRYRGGTTALHLGSFLDPASLADSLAILRSHWQRWARDGFEPGELNVARWSYTADSALSYTSGHAIAYGLFSQWNVAPDAPPEDVFGIQPHGTTLARLRELFSTCQANAVLALTGNQTTIERALKRSWPGAN